MASTTQSGQMVSVEMGQWKHVQAPSRGMITSAPPTMLPPESSPLIKGMYLKDGIVSSDWGYVSFPTPGVLATNALAGTVMKICELYRSSTGLSYLFALTTTNAYMYNTTTDTWDDVSWGTVIDLCETAWTASANVTTTRDTAVKLHGTYSSKNVIATGFTTGIVSYFNITVDISDTTQHTYLAFWAYSTVTKAADTFRIRLSEQANGGAGATYADYSVPALVANTWKHCMVDIVNPVAKSAGTFPDDLNAVASVALVAQSDPGEVTVYLDQIKAMRAFTGDEDDRFSVTVMNDTLMITNGVDHPMQCDGVSNVALATTTLAGSIDINRSEIVITLRDHLVYFNNKEGTIVCPQRVSWGDIGSISDFTNGTAGYEELVDEDSDIMAVELLTQDTAVVYKEKSIVLMSWVGGHTPFTFQTMVYNHGAAGKDCVKAVQGLHAVLDKSMFYSYNGSGDITPLDLDINNNLFSRLDGQYAHRSFITYVDDDREIQLWIPTSTSTPDEVWCRDIITKTWFKRAKAMTAWGTYLEASSKTIGELLGTIGEQNWKFGDALTKASFPIILVGNSSGVYKLDKTTLDNGGVAIENEFQTPDYTMPDTNEYQNKFMRVPQLLFEAHGQSVTTEWSEDGGNSWNPTSSPGGNTTTLNSIWDIYQQDFDAVVRKIRFKFKNVSAASGFNLRYYGFYWIVRSGRR